MAKGKVRTFDLTCPCCQAVLTVDSEVQAVVHHTQPPKTGPLSSLDKALDAIKGEPARREARFREAAESEKSKEELLSRKFQHGLKRAKDTPDRPIRPIDLD